LTLYFGGLGVEKVKTDPKYRGVELRILGSDFLEDDRITIIGATVYCSTADYQEIERVISSQ
jgi:hypothetical protein